MRYVFEIIVNIIVLIVGIAFGSIIGTEYTEKIYKEQMIEENCAYYNVHTGEFTIGAPVVGPQD